MATPILTIPIQDFSGEVSGGLLGTVQGQVFFSPSLDVAAPNSAIQVDSVSTCTQAYDVYVQPNPVQLTGFFTFGSEIPSVLGNTGFVLWAGPAALGYAEIELRDVRLDAFGPYADGIVAMTLIEPIDISGGGFLNDARWETFGGTETVFTTYNNIPPVLPGGTLFDIMPFDAVSAVDSTEIASSIVLSDAVSVTDQVTFEKLVILADSISMTDDGTVDIVGGFDPIEFSPDFEI